MIDNKPRVGAPYGNKNHYKHGKSHTRIDNIYKSMVSRCYHKENNRYKNYGGRGIAVCDEWLKDKTSFFEWAYKNGYRDDLTIDRIDVNGNYEPFNCKWSTYQEQANNRTNTVHYMICGQSHSLAEWSRISGVPYKTIYRRIKTGMLPEKAVFKAVRK